MSDTTSSPRSSDAGEIEAVLEGGSHDLPPALGRCQARVTDRKIKVVHRGGYEHFERVGEPHDEPGPRPAVFCWTTRTKMAE